MTAASDNKSAVIPPIERPAAAIAAPAIGFVIPAYNAARTLGEALASLRAQTRGDWQAIVVDDGSTDDTAGVAARFARDDARITLVRTANGGVSRARNEGLRHVVAEWVTFLDADDWVTEDYIETMLAAAGDDTDLVYCGWRRVAPDGSTVSDTFERAFAIDGFDMLARGNPLAIHSVVMRRALVANAGGFDPSLAVAEDADLWLGLTRAGARMTAVPAILAMYRLRQGSLSSDYRRALRDSLEVLRRGYAADPRVRRPVDAFAQGRKVDDFPVRAALMATWFAASEVGAGGDGASVLDHLERPWDFGGSLAALGGHMADGLIVGACASLRDLPAWLSPRQGALMKLVEAIAASRNDASAAHQLLEAIERAVLHRAPVGVPARMTRIAKVAIDARAISGIEVPRDIAMLMIELMSRGKLVGRVEIPPPRVLSKRGVAALAVGLPIYLRLRRLGGRLVNGARTTRDFSRRIARRTLRGRSLEDSESGAADGSAARERAAAWEKTFVQPDPWNYGSQYEQTKYRRTLDILPAGVIGEALELACAEGIFTEQLAPRVDRLIAADISTAALERAKARCAQVGDIDFRQIDILADPLPQGQDLIVCSEVLYFFDRAETLPTVAAKLRDALAPGGRLVMAHAFVLNDDASVTGFDWADDYGAKVIHETFNALPGLALERSIVTELYRVDCFRRGEPGEAAPAPVIRHAEIGCELEPYVARQIVWDGAWTLRQDVKRDPTWRVPVLIYHRVARDGPPALKHYRVDSEMFRRQMRLLRSAGFHSVTSRDILEARAAGKPLTGRPVLITFDDGYQDFADAAWPILEAHDFTAEVFIVTDLVGKTAEWDKFAGEPAPLMDWRTIRSLHDKGARFGSHLATHTAATDLPRLALWKEARRSRAALEKQLGTSVRSIAAPFGAINNWYRRIIALAGYRVAYSCEPAVADIRGDPLNLPRLDVPGHWELADFASALGVDTTLPRGGPPQDLVTVVIPAYDAASTIDETLRSVRAQTHRHLEILVIDDGSRDATPSIVERHAAEDARVRLIRQPNAGVAAARNRGVAEAKADLIAPIDADDLWAPAKIAKQLMALKRGGADVALVYTWWAVIEAGSRLEIRRFESSQEGRVLRQLCRVNLVGSASSPLLRKSAILEAGGYDPALRAANAQGCEDLLLHFRVAERHAFAVVREHLTGYRQSPGAMSTDVFRMLRSFQAVAAEMRAKHPEYQSETRCGEARMAEWLFWKAINARRPWSAARLLARAIRLDPRFALLEFAPHILRVFVRPRARLRRLLRRPEPMRTHFPIGSPLRVANAD